MTAELEYAMVFCLRLITPDQLARWQQVSLGAARERLRRRARKGIVRPVRVRRRTTAPITAAVVHWSPGDPAPSFAPVARLAGTRIEQETPRTVLAYRASRLLLRLYGAPKVNVLNPYQSSHDLAVTETFIFLAHDTELDIPASFRGEDWYAPKAKRGQKIPDAMILRHGRPQVAVEYVGAYKRRKLQDFHADMAKRRLPYMLF